MSDNAKLYGMIYRGYVPTKNKRCLVNYQKMQ